MTDHKRELRRVSIQGATEAAKRYKAQHPDAQGLKTRANVVAYKPRAQVVRRIPIRAVHLFLSERAWIHRSNAEIAAHFRKETGEKIPDNILTETFRDFHSDEIEKLLAQRGVKLDLTVNNTPSKVKKALAAARKVEQADTYTVSVSFTSDAVVVGEKSYPIQTGRRIHVGSKKLNVDALRLLIANSK